MALLIGYGAGAINPYLAFESIEDMIAVEGGKGVHGLGGIDPAEAVAQLHQGLRQGRAQGHVEDGRLDGGQLHGGADLRGHRPRPGPGRRVLHRHRLPPRRHRPRRDRRRGGGPPRRRPPRAGPRSGSTAAWSWAASTSGGGRASTTSSTPRRCSSSSTPPAPAATTSSSSTPAWSTTSPAGWPRCGGCSSCAPADRPPGPDRRGRAGQRDRQALLHRRHELRLDLGRGPRDAGHRHEPHRRQEQHRRGRRGRRALRAAAQRRLQALGHQAGGLRAASASPASTWSAPTTCRSRWPRAPSRARAASSRATRCTRGSPGPGTRRPASG